MKTIIKLLLIAVFILPISINANEICKDGSISPTCNTCGQGCCSHHGGCTGTQSEDMVKSNIEQIEETNDYEKESQPALSTSLKDTSSDYLICTSFVCLGALGGYLIGKGIGQ